MKTNSISIPKLFTLLLIILSVVFTIYWVTAAFNWIKTPHPSEYKGRSGKVGCP